MKSTILRITVLFLLIFGVLFPAAASAFEDCEDLPDGWWHDPRLVARCLLYEMFWECGFDLQCDDGWDW